MQQKSKICFRSGIDIKHGTPGGEQFSRFSVSCLCFLQLLLKSNSAGSIPSSCCFILHIHTNQTRADRILLTIFISLFFLPYTLPDCRRETMRSLHKEAVRTPTD